ncbi:DNA polymerase III subunit gamma/tau [Luteitalea sp.]|uniref:DNA polymerase III subunit gamma/tau n=1 Tax=Luteitalea sp. TaxID=2004800 RepID=UPI0037C73AB2
MSRPYQVLARKWRPQRFDDVVGQIGVTQTLRNAINRGRIAQSFIFSGARGVGKTTTARILARALNCETGPTADPCGTCDACIEIAEGRDIDVIELDAATHTGVDNVREVIIEGLGISPARDRYKIFIIDEVHMLSNSSFNALLKSVEEPPPHVVFMMATTELHKIPETIRSRSQEFELRTIGARSVAEQLGRIAEAEQLNADPDALLLLARSGEGSMRDALSAFDQVIAFAGERITAADVASVLGLIGRDVLMDMADIVADRRAADVFDAVGRLVESGQDLKLVVRELTGLVRDLMVVSLDPSRLEDPELATDAERLQALAARFSREDLLRAFDVLARAEQDVRYAAQPRYHLEMALLRWIHLGHLAPIAEVLEALGSGRPMPAGSPARAATPAVTRPSAPTPTPSAAPASGSALRRLTESARAASAAPAAAAPASAPTPAPAPAVAPAPAATAPSAPATRVTPPPPASSPAGPPSEAAEPAPLAGSGTLEHLIEALRKSNRTFFGTALARATFAIEGSKLLLTVGGNFEQARCEGRRSWIEETAQQVLGRRHVLEIRVVAQAVEATPDPTELDRARLKEQALKSEAVQATLDVFAADVRDAEEIT